MAFKLKSGNKPVFKMMGAVNAAAGMMGRNQNPDQETMYNKNAPGAYQKSYEEAYKDRDMKVYGDLSQEEYTKEAKRQNKIHKETGKWDYKNAPKVTKEDPNKRTSVRTVDSATDTVSTETKPHKTTVTTTDKETGNVTTEKQKENKTKSTTVDKDGEFVESSKDKKNKNKNKKRNEDGSITKSKTKKDGTTVTKTRGKGKIFFKKDKNK